MQVKHKILAIGATIIAIAIISQPAQAQNKLAGLVRYPTGTQKFYDDEIKTINPFDPWVHGHKLCLKNDTEVTEIIILGTLSSPIARKVEQINTTGCAQLRASSNQK